VEADRPLVDTAMAHPSSFVGPYVNTAFGGMAEAATKDKAGCVHQCWLCTHCAGMPSLHDGMGAEVRINIDLTGLAGEHPVARR
jgi:hypothetical protein